MWSIRRQRGRLLLGRLGWLGRAPRRLDDKGGIEDGDGVGDGVSDEEEAEDEVEVSYPGDELEIGFNVTYLLDALSAIDSEKVEIGLTDANSSCLIHAPGNVSVRYVVMPMRL